MGTQLEPARIESSEFESITVFMAIGKEKLGRKILECNLTNNLLNVNIYIKKN